MTIIIICESSKQKTMHVRKWKGNTQFDTIQGTTPNSSEKEILEIYNNIR